MASLDTVIRSARLGIGHYGDSLDIGFVVGAVAAAAAAVVSLNVHTAADVVV